MDDVMNKQAFVDIRGLKKNLADEPQCSGNRSPGPPPDGFVPPSLEALEQELEHALW
jgi:hypothetical protein